MQLLDYCGVMSNKIQCECLIQLSSTGLGDTFYFNMSPSRHNRTKEEDNMKLSCYKVDIS